MVAKQKHGVSDVQRRSPWRHLNKLRWIILSIVFAMLVLIPAISIYQTYLAAHAYDLLAPAQKELYDTMEFLTAPFTDNPVEDLDAIKGNTWSGTLFGLQLSDPLALVSQIAASLHIYWPFLMTALIPIAFTVVFGRFFCGWLCPATFLYELNSNLSPWLHKLGLRPGRRIFDPRLKYFVLAIGLIISAMSGIVLMAAIYPPAIIGRELYYAIALNGFGTGMVFFILTLLFDSLVARRGFCRYLCPGGALYALLGRYRLFRIQRRVQHCNDCAKCNAICEFGLNPMRDDFGQECNNCTACIAICPTDALDFSMRITDQPNQSDGHLSPKYQKSMSVSERQQPEGS